MANITVNTGTTQHMNISMSLKKIMTKHSIVVCKRVIVLKAKQHLM